ncbi:hypothetical protein KY290_028226 [Solanum tuberosum]|uniref:Uncharacterized protein n=1 Tax=Solanum tuberosum TaxID=4113 RepID=A0ABQ7UH97_SOLTU|nr:hypothetical protein KY290_028226 [Solanum tuberosum]
MRRNLDFMLTAEEYKFVLYEEFPLKQDEQSIDEDKAAEIIVKKPTSFMTLYVEKGSTSKPQGGQKKKKTHKAKAIAPPTGGVKKI